MIQFNSKKLLLLLLVFLISFPTFGSNEKDTLNLIEAVQNGDLDLVKRLISKGADVNAKDKYGKTPLHYADDEGHIYIVMYLISKGAKK